MLEVEICHTHPLLRAFIVILHEQVIDTKTRSSSTDGPAAHITIESGCKCTVFTFFFILANFVLPVNFHILVTCVYATCLIFLNDQETFLFKKKCGDGEVGRLHGRQLLNTKVLFLGRAYKSKSYSIRLSAVTKK